MTVFTQQITVELLGVLAELNLPEIDFRQLVTEYNLVPWISRNLAPANVSFVFLTITTQRINYID